MSRADSTMAGRVCVVTGASSGIGEATAEGLARRGATVVMVSRDPGRAEAARKRVAAAAGTAEIHMLLADLSSQASVRELAQEIGERFGSVHVLVNNAGAVFGRRLETEDGVEMTFALNHLAPFLLTTLLLDRLVASAPSRVVTVTSEAQRRGRIDLADLQLRSGYSVTRAYAQSKLANVLFTYELARRAQGTGVTANCVHPGAVRTSFARGAGGWFGLINRLAGPFERSPQRGAQTVVWLATAAEVEGVTGRYFADRAEKRSTPASYDLDLARRLWNESVALTHQSTELPPR